MIPTSGLYPNIETGSFPENRRARSKMTTLMKQIEERLDGAGLRHDAPTLNLLADVMWLAASEADGWTNRCDDAMRIPEVLHVTCDGLRDEARRLHEKK